MPRWTFYDFVDAEGNQIERWLNDKKQVPQSRREKLRSRLRNRHETHQGTELRPPQFKPLHGYEGIYEIAKLTVGGVPYRPLFCYGPGNGEVTILIGAKEHSDDLVPRNAPEQVIQRRAMVMGADGRRYVTLHDYTRAA